MLKALNPATAPTMLIIKDIINIGLKPLIEFNACSAEFDIPVKAFCNSLLLLVVFGNCIESCDVTSSKFPPSPSVELKLTSSGELFQKFEFGICLYQ